MTELGDLPWPDVAARAGSSLLILPLGATEQHGPHLPLSTDTLIAVALAQRLADRRPGAVVAPAVAYGSSGEHAGFAGTLSIGREAVEMLLVELVRSADAFAGVVIVSTHGGNAEPLWRAADRLQGEGRAVRAWSPPAADPTDAHAGWVETSVLLALDTATVHLDRAEAGVTSPIRDLWPILRSSGVGAVSANGVLGDPGGASAEQGRRLLEAWTVSLLEAVEMFP